MGSPGGAGTSPGGGAGTGPKQTPQLLTIPQAAQFLQVSAKTMYRLIAARKIACVNVGIGRSRMRIHIDALLAFQQANTTPAKKKVA